MGTRRGKRAQFTPLFARREFLFFFLPRVPLPPSTCPQVILPQFLPFVNPRDEIPTRETREEASGFLPTRWVFLSRRTIAICMQQAAFFFVYHRALCLLCRSLPLACTCSLSSLYFLAHESTRVFKIDSLVVVRFLALFLSAWPLALGSRFPPHTCTHTHARARKSSLVVITMPPVGLRDGEKC